MIEFPVFWCHISQHRQPLHCFLHTYNSFGIWLVIIMQETRMSWDLGMFCLYLTVQGIGGDRCARDKDVKSHGYALQQFGLNAQGTRIMLWLLFLLVNPYSDFISNKYLQELYNINYCLLLCTRRFTEEEIFNGDHSKRYHGAQAHRGHSK